MQIDTKALVKKLDNLSVKALESGINLAVKQKTQEVTIAHWLSHILSHKDSFFCKLLLKADIKPGDLLQAIRADAYDTRGTHNSVPSLSNGVTTLIHDSWLVASVDFQEQEINSGHIFICLVTNLKGFYINSLAKSLLRSVDVTSLKEEFKTMLVEQTAVDSDDTQEEYAGDTNGALRNFTVDLIEQASKGRLDRAIGRNGELRQIIDILCRRKQNNPVLVGDAGTGKTAIVEELAFAIAEGNVPKNLKNASLRLLDYAALQAGASVQGEFESRIKDLLSAIQKSTKKIILFIDEVHNFLGGGSKGSEAANLLKPALAKGLSVIGATTWAEYKKSFEKDAALNRRFQLIKVLEPSEDLAKSIMRKVGTLLEEHHGVAILDSGITDSVGLSIRYMNHLRLPDKSISLLDSACTRIKLQQSIPPLFVKNLEEKITLRKAHLKRLENDFSVPTVKKEKLSAELTDMQSQYDEHYKLWQEQIQDLHHIFELKKKEDKTEYIAKAKEVLSKENLYVYPVVDNSVVSGVLSEWTGIPISKKQSASQLESLLTLDAQIKERVVGQDHAIDRIAEAIRISRANISDPRKPIGVFLLVGESGIGKTETALSLAETIYGSESKMITINMSEYKEGHKVASLIGSPPGYVGFGEGGRLTEAVRRNPYSVILLDEIEKAHPNVQDIFLQVFDKGTLTDSEGIEVDFKNTIIILTSNLGSKTIRDFCAKKKESAKDSKEKNTELKSKTEDGQAAAQFEDENSEDNMSDQDETEGVNLEQVLEQNTKEESDNYDDEDGNEEEQDADDDNKEDSENDSEGKKKPLITEHELKALDKVLHEQLTQSLRPEFLGRLVTIPYLSLTPEILSNIIKIQLARLSKRIKENHDAEFVYEDSAVEKIRSACQISAIGARQIEHIIKEDILPDLAIAILDIQSQNKSFEKIVLKAQFNFFSMEFKGIKNIK
jgi:type VI secretion system protein VasG